MYYIMYCFAAYAIGLLFVLLAEVMPIFKQVFFHMFGWVIMGIPIAIFIYRLIDSGAYPFFRKKPTKKHLIQFLYRDGSDVPLYGSRLHPGMSFIDVPKLGLVHDIGKTPEPGSVYDLGDKKMRFALENVGHTPNPKYGGFTHWMRHELGIQNIDDLAQMVRGQNDYLLVEVYHKLLDPNTEKPEETFIRELGDADTKNIKKKQHNIITDFVDRLFKHSYFNKRKGGK